MNNDLPLVLSRLRVFPTFSLPLDYILLVFAATILFFASIILLFTGSRCGLRAHLFILSRMNHHLPPAVSGFKMAKSAILVLWLPRSFDARVGPRRSRPFISAKTELLRISNDPPGIAMVAYHLFTIHG